MDINQLKVRSIEEEELPKVIAFLNESLRPGVSWSIEEEYPQVFDKKSCPYIRVIEKQGQIVSHAAWRPLIVKTKLGLFKVAVIGSVVTDSQHRKQGYSKQIIESVIHEAGLCGCEFAILWSDKVDFYNKFSFELVGSQVTAVIDQSIPHEKDASIRILKGNKVGAEAIHRLYQTHTVSSVRSLDEVQKFLNIPNSDIYTAWRDNQLLAYMVEGKGADFDSYIHEWAGDIASLTQLANHIHKEQGRAIHWMMPSHSKQLIQKLEEKGLYLHRGYLGMIRTLNVSSLFSKIVRYARGAMCYPDFELIERNDKYYLGFGEKLYEFHSLEEITKVIFGPNDPSDIRGIDQETGKKLDKILPIHMWVWGWDSI